MDFAKISRVESERLSIAIGKRRMVVCFEMSSEVESERVSATEKAAPGTKPKSLARPAKKQKPSFPEHSPPCEVVGKAQGIVGDALAAYMAKHWPDEWF